ncbi:NADP-dependent oxidoreductase [Litorihabitans aurantiacus]|uniref:Enoyl reductase (ER) domain-containing protein n=1 Tax=Litorihabitans aurantiacus TaxID=1930061 RepID=A0AA38CXT5_9MICO|nr:hypothetical protein GCM10025875_37540 [Litorihabitans aurantiacus]
MKAVRFHETGGPEVLRYEEVDRPEAGAGQVRVRVAGVAHNPADGGMRGGFLPIPITLPHTPGYDVSGTVDQVGDGVEDLSVGQEVVGFIPMAGDGAAAQYVTAPAESFVPAPATIPLADAAGLPSVGLTASQALFDVGGLTFGQRVLINGAGGPVGGMPCSSPSARARMSSLPPARAAPRRSQLTAPTRSSITPGARFLAP